MTGQEDEEMPTERLLRESAEDWARLEEIRERLPRRIVLLRRRGLAGQRIASETGVPETNIRRWSKGSAA